MLRKAYKIYYTNEDKITQNKLELIGVWNEKIYIAYKFKEQDPKELRKKTWRIK